MVFEGDIFSPRRLEDPRAASVLEAAADRAAGTVRPSDVLAAALASGEAKVTATLAQALESGATPRDVAEVIEAYNPRSETRDFDGRRERFASETLEALAAFEAEMASVGESAGNVGLELLLASILDHLDDEDRASLMVLDAPTAAARFRETARAAAEAPTPLFDAASGRLRSEELTDRALDVLRQAGARAAELGYDRILPPHVYLALIGETEGLAEHVVRRQAPLLGPGRVAEAVASTFRLQERGGDPLPLDRDSVSETLEALLGIAQRAARSWGAERIDTTHFLAALLAGMPPRLASVLQGAPIELDLELMKSHVEQALDDARDRDQREVPFELPSGLLPAEDLTHRARTEGLPPGVGLDACVDRLLRALHRRHHNHALVTGLKGVGKTTLVRELARRAASGAIPFLHRRRFLWVDCSDVPPADSGGKLRALFSHAAGRSEVVLCLDGLGPLLRAESGGDHKLALRAALKEQRVQVIGVMSDRDFEDLMAADHELLELFSRVAVEEPDRKTALKIVEQVRSELAQEFGVDIDAAAVERSVTLSAEYILNERLPVKAVDILRRVCEDVEFARAQGGKARTAVSEDDVIATVSDVSGVPESTLRGQGDNADYEGDLGRVVVGQEAAVAAVAMDLQLIKAGLTDPSKPASVMMFAGLTGVGKTELAKALARFYSTSKRLRTYTMGNFTESHSLSGLIGVPPGYVGHEQGGRLINDLNEDPYCVVLLDEAEKAHPDVWKPFLNLFDESWIVDQRGVKAFGDRAIFILTTNAGQDTIAELAARGEPMERIVEAVRRKLEELRSERSNQPVFAPEFLARIRRIIIFKPLDRNAMEGICRKLVARMQGDWRTRRRKTIRIPEELIGHIADRSHEANTRAGGKEGGRIVAKLISELVEVGIQEAATDRPDEYKRCNVVELTFLPPAPVLPHGPTPIAKVEVLFHATNPAAERIAAAKAELRRAVERAPAPGSAALGTLRHLEGELAAADASAPDGLLATVRDARTRVESLMDDANAETDRVLRQVLDAANEVAS